MPDSTTANYGWTLPTNNADDDTWGELLNGNWTALDSQLFGIAGAAMPLAGGTFTGAVSGTAATFTGTVTAAAFTGPLAGNVTGSVSGPSGSCSGNAATASALQTARSLSFSGDAAGGLTFDGSADASAALTLATVNANVGEFGSASATPVLTLDGKGRVTAASTAPLLPGVPSGAILAFAMASAPSGWLECDGSTYSQAGYPALAAALGVSSGSFAVPDLRGQFLRGWAHAGSVDAGRALLSGQAASLGPITVYEAAGSDSGGTAAGFSGGGDAPVYNNPATSPSSGAETRPMNVAVMFCIKT